MSAFPGRGRPGSPGRIPRRGYTLIEVLVVAVVIVLMLGMALPVFRTITGSRSEAGAANVIASMLGRARDDALGLQQPYGVAFVYNQSTQQTSMAEVYFPNTQSWSVLPTVQNPPPPPNFNVPPGGYVAVPYGSAVYYYINPSRFNTTVTVNTYAPTPPTSAAPEINGTLYPVGGPPLEMVADTDLVGLPAGIGVQTVCNCTYSGSQRGSNGYLTQGVILFDGTGRVVSQPYGISISSKLALAAALQTTNPNSLGWPAITNIGELNTSGYLIKEGIFSQFGLVVYQNEAYQSQKSPTQPEALYTDPTPSGNGSLNDYTNGTPSQQQADSWLDQNATPLLIDRYTGTLIKAE